MPKGFLDKLWLVIYGSDSCHFIHCGVNEKQQCLYSSLGQVREAVLGWGWGAVHAP